MNRKTLWIGIILVTVMALTLVVGEVEINKYVPVLNSYDDGQGTIEISVLCGHNLFSKEILIKNTEDPDWVWAKSVQLDGNGKYEDRYFYGVYDIWLVDGNGGHSEYRTVSVNIGYQNKVTFIGHAVTMNTGNRSPSIPIPTPTPLPTPEPTPTPIPTPCYWVNETTTVYHPEVNHTVYIPDHYYTRFHDIVNNLQCIEKGHWEIIIDQVAWTEFIESSRWQCYG